MKDIELYIKRYLLYGSTAFKFFKSEVSKDFYVTFNLETIFLKLVRLVNFKSIHAMLILLDISSLI